MSKHHPHQPPPKTIDPDTDPEPVTRDESALLDPEPSEFAQAPAPVRAHAERVAGRGDLTAELSTLPASNDLSAIQANAGAGYYADKHDHLLADLNALTFDDAAATAQRDVIVQRLSAGVTK